MADLEALTRIDTPPQGTGSKGSKTGQFTWHYALPVRREIRLGSDPIQCDWAVPEDRMISRFHATLYWDGETLTVARRGVLPPDHPNPPQNHIWFQNKPAEKCEVRRGEWFVIGQTRFTVRGDGDVEPDSPVDGTLVQREEEFTRAQLEELPYTNPAAALKAMEQLPSYLKLATNEPLLFRQMLKVVLEALPRADATAIVRIPPDARAGDLRIALVEQNIRRSPVEQDGEFVPSRRLVRRAVDASKSCLHVWSTDPKDATQGSLSDHDVTLGMMRQQGVRPWAVCTPFQDGSKHALYVSGRLTGGVGDTARDTKQLNEYQKIADLLVGLLETTRRTLKLARQNAVIREAWPSGIRKFFDNPDQLEALLKPQEKDVTVLFCDLRNYSLQTEARGDQLTQAWREVASALDVMSGAITEKGGVVAGFRGDAVLGFWGWPEALPDQVERAASAALKIHDKLLGRMQERKCGLGLTHGRALAGRLGAHDLAVVDLYGPIVNLAFRLEEMTKAFGVGIIVSDQVAASLAEKDPEGTLWRTRHLGRVRPRGVKTALSAHELVRPDSTAWVIVADGLARAKWNEAVEWLISGQWTSARERLNDLFPDDPAAQCLLRVMSGRDRPTDWDGSFVPPPPRD